QPAAEPTQTTNLVSNINHTLSIDPNSYTVTLSSISFEPSVSMTWNFDVWNKSTVAGNFEVNRLSYVSDDLGNQYAVISALAVNVPAGVRTAKSVSFEPPKPGANVFTLHIAGFAGVHLLEQTISISAVLNPDPTSQPTSESQSLKIVKSDINKTLSINPESYS